jgi:hypothetical protein
VIHGFWADLIVGRVTDMKIEEQPGFSTTPDTWLETRCAASPRIKGAFISVVHHHSTVNRTAKIN